jgi:hypothetical protein
MVNGCAVVGMIETAKAARLANLRGDTLVI